MCLLVCLVDCLCACGDCLNSSVRVFSRPTLSVHTCSNISKGRQQDLKKLDTNRIQIFPESLLCLQSLNNNH